MPDPMNADMNGSGVWQDTDFVSQKQLDGIQNPASSWVLIEEREDSINDGYFAVMVGARYDRIECLCRMA
jgi:hypothetical protein